jgi:hypothetical protein
MDRGNALISIFLFHYFYVVLAQFYEAFLRLKVRYDLIQMFIQ